jgi:predicted nucleic acid-binding protein
MGAVLLDTTVLIDVLRGREGAVTRLLDLHRAGDTSYACAINAEELLRGVRRGEEVAVNRLLAGVRVAPLGFAEGARAGEWRRTYRQRGRTLAQADCLIAAAAIGVGARLATGNPKDFPMREVVVEHWPVSA